MFEHNSKTECFHEELWVKEDFWDFKMNVSTAGHRKGGDPSDDGLVSLISYCIRWKHKSPFSCKYLGDGIQKSYHFQNFVFWTFIDITSLSKVMFI